MDSAEIRLSRPSDSQQITDILRDTFQSTWSAHLNSIDIQRFWEEDHPAAYFGARGHYFWVAERADTVLGFVDWSESFVNALHVHSIAARSGIGNLLMDHAETQIAASGHADAKLETHTFNARSRAFYAKRGFVEREEYEDTEWQSGLRTLLLVKQLI